MTTPCDCNEPVVIAQIGTERPETIFSRQRKSLGQQAVPGSFASPQGAFFKMDMSWIAIVNCAVECGPLVADVQHQAGWRFAGNRAISKSSSSGHVLQRIKFSGCYVLFVVGCMTGSLFKGLTAINRQTN